MYRLSSKAVWLSLVSLVAIAGCPLTNNPDDGGDPTTPTTVVGTWTGTLTGTSTKTVDDIAGTPLPRARSLTIKIGDDFVPTSVPIWGFDNAYDRSTTKTQVGESETFEYEANIPYREITLTATVREVSYAKDKIRIVMDLEYSSANIPQGLTEDGTGEMTLEGAINGEYLSITGVAQYTISQSANEITVETKETISYTGTLSKPS